MRIGGRRAVLWPQWFRAICDHTSRLTQRHLLVWQLEIQGRQAACVQRASGKTQHLRESKVHLGKQGAGGCGGPQRKPVGHACLHGG